MFGGVCHSGLTLQVPVVYIDYATMEAIRMNSGFEEREKLTPGTSGFAVCTWEDSSSYQSTVANLMLEVKKIAKTMNA